MYATLKMDPTTCLEAVLVEPRALHYTAVALQSALGVQGIDLVTLVHGKSNGEFSKQLVKGNEGLANAYEQGTLTLLPLPVNDLGGDEPVNIMPATAPRPNLLVISQRLVRRDSAASAEDQSWHHEYTRLLLSPGFWKLLQCDRVLTFQSDTVFCHGSPVNIDEFKPFAYVGGETPGLSRSSGRVHMNGGFSLRTRPAMLQCIEHDMHSEVLHSGMGEDEIFSQCLSLEQPPKKLMDRFAIDNALKLPTTSPLGVHKPWAGPFKQEITKLCSGAQTLIDAFHKEPKCLLRTIDC